jgi:multidrug resistance protein, MATE family
MPDSLLEVRKTLWLALPMVIGQVASQLMHATDLAMVGRVGVVPLSAAAFGATVYNFFWLFGIGPVTALSILVGEAHGAGREDQARFVLRQGLVLTAVFGLILTGLVLGLTQGTDFWRLGQPAEVADGARNYLAYLAASTTPLLLFIAFKAYNEARGWPWLPLWFNLGSILLNIVLNWIFIYGNLGAPAMGLDGAGLATFLSRVLTLVAFWAYLRRAPRPGLSWTRAEWRVIDPRKCWELLRLGMPIGFQIVLEVAAFSSALIFVGWLPNGTVALAAHSIALNYAALAFMVPLGVMFAASIRVGQARGAAEFARARVIGWSTLAVAVGFMACVALVFTLGRHQLPHLFLQETVGDDAPAVIALASTLLLLAAAFAVFDGTQVTVIGVLRGYRDVRLPTIFTFIAYWLLCLPMGFWLAFRLDGTDTLPGPVARVVDWLPLPPGLGLGAPGVWLGLVLGLVVVSIALVWRFVVIGRRAEEEGARSRQATGGGAEPVGRGA